MTDQDLFALCVWDEATGEPYEGKVAVARVILNRMAALYESDGTVEGTVLAPSQFSGFWFAMASGRYVRVAWTLAEARARAEGLLVTARRQSATWELCVKAVEDARDGSGFQGGPDWNRLAAQPRALMYVNLAVCAPGWAKPDLHVAKIYHHDFFRA